MLPNQVPKFFLIPYFSLTFLGQNKWYIFQAFKRKVMKIRNKKRQ